MRGRHRDGQPDGLAGVSLLALAEQLALAERDAVDEAERERARRSRQELVGRLEREARRTISRWSNGGGTG